MNQVFYIVFESLLQLTIGPFFHGVLMQDYFLYYNLQYLCIRALAEVVIIILNFNDQNLWCNIRVVISFIRFFWDATAYIFDLDIGNGLFMKLSQKALEAMLVRFFLSLSYSLLMYIVNTLSILWSAKVTDSRWFAFLSLRAFHWILTSTCYYSILIVRAVIVPSLLLQSPLILRPSGESMEQLAVIQKNETSAPPTIFRVVGEEVHFNCRLQASLIVSDMALIWMLNGSEVKHDKEHILSFRKSKSKYIHQLLIKSISAADFGEYHCIRREKLHDLEECDLDGINYCLSRLTSNEILLRSLLLNEKTKEIANVTARVGTVFNMQNILNYHILQYDNLELLHTVNGINHSEVCSNSKYASGHIPTRHHIQYKLPSCFPIRGEYQCNISFAVCVNSFGIHEFALLKHGESKRLQIVYPLRLLVIPQETILSTKHHYEFYDQLITTVLNYEEKNETNLQNVTFQLIQAKESLELRNCEFLAIFCRLVITLILFIVTDFVDTLCNTLSFGIIYLFEEDKYQLGLVDQNNKKKGKIKYDIFISFCDADRKFVCQNLIPLLETRLHLRVCKPDIDIHYGLNTVKISAQVEK